VTLCNFVEVGDFDKTSIDWTANIAAGTKV